MIKFNASGEKKGKKFTLIGLGLSEMNLQKLREGMPIVFDGAEVGIPGHEILIMYGKTEQDMYDDLKAQGLVK